MQAQRITRIAGTAIPLRGDDIDTDRIMPARYLKTITFNDLDRHVFEDDRAAAKRAGTLHPLDDSRYRGATILIVNTNFGCGSSREHAPQGLQKRGIRAIVGESFSDIFFNNATVIGLPCVTASPDEVHELMERVEERPEATLRIDLTAGTCELDGFTCMITLPAHARDAFVSGAWDSTGLLLARYDDVNAVAQRLPYLNGF
jgi:3-isopropylmalate/(R)-2-methylmalate dehydratase small subunit